MGAFFKLLIVALCTFIACILAAQTFIWLGTKKMMESSIQSDFILIGDSHAQNLPWPENRNAFILPGSGLFHTYLVVKQITKLANASSPRPILVATIWPGSFSPDQEKRYSGEFRDSWGAAIGGSTCNYWSISDWSSPVIPNYLKLQAVLGKIQFSRTNTHRKGNSCSEPRESTKQIRVEENLYRGTWLDDAHISWWCFDQINTMVHEANMTLIWVSTPTHPRFFEIAENTNRYINRFPTQTPSIHHFNALNFSQDTNGFLDYHHINCHIASPLADSIESYFLTFEEHLNPPRQSQLPIELTQPHALQQP